MRRLSVMLAACALTSPGADWPTDGGSPQRDGWAKQETAFTKDNVKGLELLYKYNADNQARTLNTLTTPLISGRIITYLGFKEMLVVGGSSDNVYSLDADLNRLIWKRHLEYKGERPRVANGNSTCPGGLSAPIAMAGSSTVAVARGAGGRGRGAVPGAIPVRAIPVRPANRGGEFFAVGSDGALHILNTSTGADREPPLPFVPPDSKVSSLNVSDGEIYAATMDQCGGNPNAIYAIPSTGEERKVTALPLNGGNTAGSAGTAIGSDGTVYATVADLHKAAGDAPNDTLLALTPKTLAIRDYFAVPLGEDISSPGVSPVVFQWKGSDLIVAGARDGHVYLLDSKLPGGADHKTPLAQIEYSNNGGFRGALASWEDTQSKIRWVYGSTGRYVEAFKVEERNGHPELVKAWTSKDMIAPSPVVTANGLVFVLATGDARRAPNRAALHVLDGLTGTELYSSGDMTATWTHGSGLAIANRRIYFSTHDNVVYCLGFPAEQPQLFGR